MWQKSCRGESGRGAGGLRTDSLSPPYVRPVPFMMPADLVLLLALILLNGLLSMAEIAVVSARRARLVQLADEGRRGAARALELAAEPTRFLSTVQIGITAIGILSGAIGESAVAARLRGWLESTPALAPWAGPLSLVAMVAVVSYLSLIFGELVPKRLAMARPEGIASLTAAPLHWLAAATRPLVHVLSLTTDGILRLVRVPDTPRPAITMEEMRILLEQGTREGVFEEREQELVTNVLNLDERFVGAILTPRAEVVYLDLDDPPDVHRDRLREGRHEVLPVCRGGLDHVTGVVRSRRVLEQLLSDRPLDPAALVEPPLYVPATMSLMALLEHFRRARLPTALVVDEFGSIDGVVSLSDVVAAIVGTLPGERDGEPLIVVRDDGSWLFDGALDVDVVARTLGLTTLHDTRSERREYHTLGGLTMAELGRVPRTGDHFMLQGFRFEIVDMDGHRVDRVLVSRI